ncbi:hypothetical protein GBAR_LOCUS13419, partial [Geodia barretti]
MDWTVASLLIPLVQRLRYVTMTVGLFVMKMIVSSTWPMMHTGPGVVGLEQTFYTTSEGVGTVEVCAVVYSPNGSLACPIDFAFSVELQTRDGDAVSTMDYGSITTTLPFGRCDTRSRVNVPITDDEVLEDTESFFVSLLRNGLKSTITLVPTQGEIEIIDNDVAVIGLERTVYSIQEGSARGV